jgi:hypothetical protein
MKSPSMLFRGLLILAPLGCGAQTLYDFGNPTADEQLYIELINRARANPTAEGIRLAASTDPEVLDAYSFFSVDLNMMKTEFAAIAATPPLVPNAPLTNCARNHSLWMFNNNIQSHGSGANSLENRIIAAQYQNYATAGENVYAFAKSVWQGHAGFQVDWGTGGTGGMQLGRGHRVNIHNAAFREIGVGVHYGSKSTGANPVGPTQVTQEFGRRHGMDDYGTGVAYYDLDGDNFYDAGEGIAGLNVSIAGSSSYCVTALGGGWAVPVPTAAGTRAVTFSGLNINQTSNLSFPGSANAKLDLKLTYAAPTISSSATAYVNSPKTITFNKIGGATGYKWRRWSVAAAAAENCESTANITYQNYASPINTVTKFQGNSSFHIANSSPSSSRWIELNSIYVASASPGISYRSRVGWATPDERFKLQFKEEGTNTWVDISSQTGTNTQGETSFSLRNPSITSWANKRFRIRFLLEFTPGGFFFTPDNTTGWFIDAINFTNINQLNNVVVTDLADSTGSYIPTGTGTILQAIYPVISGNEFPATFQSLTIQAGPPPGFAGWALSFETANSIPYGTLTSANADYDKDGRVNLLEYTFGTSPVSPSGAAPRWPKIVSASPTSLVMEYQVDTTLTDVTVTPQASLTLGTWFGPADGGRPAGFVDAEFSTSGNIQTRRTTLPLTAGQKGFLRVKATQNP